MHYGVVAILIKLVNSFTTLLSAIYQTEENDYFYIRYAGVVTVLFVLAIISLACSIFSRDHHKDYKNGLRPPYIKYTIVEEKD